MKRLWRAILFSSIIIALSGCGGSGGGGSDTHDTVNYHLKGIGVVEQSLTFEGSRAFAALRKGCTGKLLLKASDLQQLRGGKRASGILRADSDDELDNYLNANKAYIYLSWDSVAGATHYQISYQGTVVWDSAAVDDEEDPAFDASDPCAYLDLSNELAYRIEHAGDYSFQVTAYNGANVVARMPAVTISLAMMLHNFPTGITYNPGTHQLTWTAVANAGGYRVRVCDETGTEIPSAGSGTTLLTTTSYVLSGAGLTSGTYYYLFVEAYAMDRSGNPIEMTRGRNGFNY